ncbi:MAG TPA: metal ABC transporter substrate-binding protein [Anaerolineales bacterium]
MSGYTTSDEKDLTSPKAEMRLVNKTFVFLAIALVVLLLFACSTPPASTGKLNVVASTQILGDVVAAIGGESIELTVLIPPASDPHAFEPVPQDAARLADAELIFINGLNLEEALGQLLSAEGLSAITVSAGVMTIASGVQEGEPDGSDPHVWMNPLNVKIWADNIAAALAAADPQHAAAYRANAAAYQAELDALDAWAVEQFSQIPVEDRVLVTDHESLGYFADHYGFQVVGALIPSRSTVSEPSASQLAELEDAIRHYGVKAVFIGVNTNPQLAERVAADTGVELVLLYIESLSEPGGSASSYLDLIRFDVEAILTALQ